MELAAELADVKRDGAGVSTDDGRMTWLEASVGERTEAVRTLTRLISAG